MTQIYYPSSPPNSPAGGNKQIQFNNTGAFGANSAFTIDTALGELEASIFRSSSWYFAGGLLESDGQSVGFALQTAGCTGSNAGGEITITCASTTNGVGGWIDIKTEPPLGSGTRGDVFIQNVAMPIPGSGNNAQFMMYDHASLSYILSTPSSSGSQTPWTSNIDANEYDLNDIGNINGPATGVTIAASSASIEIGPSANTVNINGTNVNIAGSVFDFNATTSIVLAYNTITRFKLDSTGVGFFGATPVAQQSHITDPSGGVVIDSESRTAIAAIIDALEAFGLTGI